MFGGETRVAALGLGVTGLFFLAVLASGYVDPQQLFELFRIYLFGMAAVWLFLILSTLLLILWQGRPRNGEGDSALLVVYRGLVKRFRGEGAVILLWPLLMFALLISAFNAFKQQILVIQPFAHDPWLADADRWLFFGQDGWLFFHNLFGSPTATWLIDTAYHSWFVAMALGVIVCGFLGPDRYRLRTQYLLTYIFVWIGLGVFLAFLLPSAGPCFYNALVGPHESYAQMMATLRAHDEMLGAGGGNLVALYNMHHLLETFGSDTLAIGGGISAMPSVHNALAVLFALGAFQLNRWLGYIMAAYAVLIWVGSVYLGWHYASDGIVAAIAVVIFWKAAGRIADALDKPAAKPTRVAPVAQPGIG